MTVSALIRRLAKPRNDGWFSIDGGLDGNENDVFTKRSLPALNLIPKAYRYSPEYVEYVNGFEQYVRRQLAHTRVDDLNVNMFNSFCDAMLNDMIAYARFQKQLHIAAVDDITRKATEELEAAQRYLAERERELEKNNNLIHKYELLERQFQEEDNSDE